MEECIKVVLEGYMEENPRKIYVFRNVNKDRNDEREYIMCTQSPNWNCSHIEIFQEGFLTFKDVRAGHDTYYSNALGRDVQYQYDGTYLLNFVPLTHVLKDGFVTKAQQLTIS